MLDGNDTGVENVLTKTDGCTILDLIRQASDDAADRADFIRLEIVAEQVAHQPVEHRRLEGLEPGAGEWRAAGCTDRWFGLST